MGLLHAPHDRLFHFTFRHPVHVATWLRAVLPQRLVAAIDWSTLAPASERLVGTRLRPHLADLVFVVRLRGRGRLRGPSRLRDHDEWLLILLEHKAFPDPGTRPQLLRYVVHLRRLAMPAPTVVPMVVPVLLQHGGSLPRQADEQDDLTDPELRAILVSLQPQQRFVVDDLTERSEEQLRRAGLTPLAQLTHLCLECLPRHQGAQALAAIDRWGDLLRAIETDPGPPLGDDAVDAIGWYLLEVTELTVEELQMAFSKHLTHARSPIMSTAQRIHREGLSQGLTQGLSQGQAATLRRLLQQRFGPLPDTVTARLAAATGDELDRWTDRLLAAPDLDAMFAD